MVPRELCTGTAGVSPAQALPNTQFCIHLGLYGKALAGETPAVPVKSRRDVRNVMKKGVRG